MGLVQHQYASKTASADHNTAPTHPHGTHNLYLHCLKFCILGLDVCLLLLEGQHLSYLHFIICVNSLLHILNRISPSNWLNTFTLNSHCSQIITSIQFSLFCIHLIHRGVTSWIWNLSIQK